MPTIFEVLPGMEVPVDGISRSFAKLWADTAVSEQKAMQLNLVVHLGFGTTAPDALDQFQVAVRLAQRYPCRVVFLCPVIQYCDYPQCLCDCLPFSFLHAGSHPL